MTINLHARQLLKSQFFWSNLLIVLIFVFFLWNVQDGHDWGGDFSMYIMNAKNIVSGAPYAQTGYVYNVDTAYYGPPAYPPVFPLMLAPMIAVWGVNLPLLKLPGIFCFIGALVFLNNCFVPKETPPCFKFLFLITTGFYPYFFTLSESIISDFPFLLFSYLALYLMDKQPGSSIKASDNLSRYFLTGIIIYLAYGARSVGLVLLPVAFLIELIRNKKVTGSLIIIVLVPLVLILFQKLLIPQTGAYFDQISLSGLFSTIHNSVIYYFLAFVNIFSFDNFIVMGVVFSIMLEGFVIGLIVHLKKGISSFDIFFFFYIGLLMMWPSYQGLRFLVPVIPIYFLYSIEGFKKIICSIKIPWLRKAIPFILLSGLIVYYASTYITIFPRPVSDIKKNETRELFQIIQAETNSDDVILFFKPRVLALYTQRKSVAMAFPLQGRDNLARMKEFGVRIAVLRKNYDLENQKELRQFISTHPDNFKLLFENPDFRVYQTIYSFQ